MARTATRASRCATRPAARRSPPSSRRLLRAAEVRAGRRVRPGDRLLRQGDRPRRGGARLRDGRPRRRDPGGRPRAGRWASEPSTSCSAAGVAPVGVGPGDLSARGAPPRRRDLRAVPRPFRTAPAGARPGRAAAVGRQRPRRAAALPPPRGGRHPRRLRHRPGHPLVPQRPLPGLQDRGGDAAGAAGPVPAGRSRPSRPSGSSSGRWSSSRPTTPWRLRPTAGPTTRRSSGSSSARSTRTSPNVSAMAGSSCWDRRRGITYDADGVREKWGVSPDSIPDYLALVGDSADGYPGPPGLGLEVRGRRPRPLRIPRRHPRPCLVLGRARRRARRRDPGGRPRRAPRRGARLPDAGPTAARCRHPPANPRGARLARRRSGGLGGLLRRARPRSAPSTAPPLAGGLRSSSPAPRASGSDERPGPGSVSSRTRTSTARCAAAHRRARDPGSPRGVGRAASGTPRVQPPRPRLQALPLVPP